MQVNTLSDTGFLIEQIHKIPVMHFSSHSNPRSQDNASPQQKQVSDQEAQKSFSSLNSTITQPQSSVRFIMDKKEGEIILKVVDASDSTKVFLVFPPDKLLQLAAKIREGMQGLYIDESL